MTQTIYPCLAVYQPDTTPSGRYGYLLAVNDGPSASLLTLVGGAGCLTDPDDRSSYLDWDPSNYHYSDSDNVYFYLDFGPVVIPENAIVTCHAFGIPGNIPGGGETDLSGPIFSLPWFESDPNSTDFSNGAFAHLTDIDDGVPSWGADVIWLTNRGTTAPVHSGENLYMDSLVKNGLSLQYGFRLYGAQLVVTTGVERQPAGPKPYIYALAGAPGYPVVGFDQSGQLISHCALEGTVLPYGDGSMVADGVAWSATRNVPICNIDVYNPYNDWFLSDDSCAVVFGGTAEEYVTKYTRTGAKLLEQLVPPEMPSPNDSGGASTGEMIGDVLYYFVRPSGHNIIIAYDVSSNTWKELQLQPGPATGQEDDLDLWFMQDFCIDPKTDSFYVLWMTSSFSHIAPDYWSMQTRLVHYDMDANVIGGVQWFNDGGYLAFEYLSRHGVVRRDTDLIFGGTVNGAPADFEESLFTVSKSSFTTDGTIKPILLASNQLPQRFASIPYGFSFGEGIVPVFPASSYLDSEFDAVRVHFT